MSGGSDRVAREIRSAKDLSSVVRSMKALAASSVGQYERAVESLHDYTLSLRLALGVCLRETARAPALPGRPLPIGIVILGSDQGLVGRFNEILLDFVTRELKNISNPVACVWAIGASAEQLIADAGLPSARGLAAPHTVEMITPVVGELLVQIDRARSAGTVDALFVFHNEPQPSGAYQPTLTRLLPLDTAWETSLETLHWQTKSLPEVIDGAASALPGLVRNYLFTVLFQACAQSLASENASRLGAMQRAEENISAMLLTLTGEFHRLRQTSIDEELFEVISGCEALGSPA